MGKSWTVAHSQADLSGEADLEAPLLPSQADSSSTASGVQQQQGMEGQQAVLVLFPRRLRMVSSGDENGGLWFVNKRNISDHCCDRQHKTAQE